MPSANTPNYDPNRPPQFEHNTDATTLAMWLYREFSALSISLLDTPALELRTINQPPTRPREGMIVFADGTNWDPGSGKGWYGYRNGVWVPFAPPLLPIVSGVASTVAGTASATAVMMGLGLVTNFSITPIRTGRVMALMTGTVSASANNAQFEITGRHGTGTAPANGAAATGTLFATPQDFFISTLKDVVGFTVMGGNTGLALNVPVWFDLTLAVTAGGTVTMSNVQCILQEV